MRWTPKRKAEVLNALKRGELTREEAMAEHGLSEAELISWMRRQARHGLDGLAVGRTQELRA